MQVFFFKVSALFWYFFCSISFVTSIYLLLTIKKVSKKYFYAFSGILVVSPAWLVCGKLRIPGKAWTISMGWRFGNSFLYIFSRFLSFTEILDTFDFLCLWFFSLTDLFLCASETKTQQQQGGFLFFQTTRKHFWNMVNKNRLPRQKLHLSQEKNLSRKTLDCQDRNDVNDSVKMSVQF